MYGLETIELTDTLKSRLDAFQIRGLRHILKIEHSYWSRVANEEILAKANAIMAKKDWTTEWRQFLPENRRAKPRIKLLSQIQEDRKRRLLGHIIRTDDNDPTRRCVF